MEFQTLLQLFDGKEPDLSKELLGSIQTLLERKVITEEKDINPQMPIIIDFIKNECAKQKMLSESLPDDHKRDCSEINLAFRKALDVR